MGIKVSNHAKIRWYERFINSGNIDGNIIEQEIKTDFESAKFIKKQKDGTSVYKNNQTFFIVNNDIDNDKFIITLYPISYVIKDFDKNVQIQQEIKNAIIEQNESYELQVYKKVLCGDLPKFPQGFWQEDIGGETFTASKECTQYMFKQAGWNYSDILTKSSKKLFTEYKLSGMVAVLFQGSWHLAVSNAYSSIKPYMLKNGNSVSAYWENDGIEKAKEMGVWLTEELNHNGYKFTPKNILSLRWNRIFKEYNLKPVLTIVFNNNLIDFFNIVFGSNLTEIDLMRYEMDNEKYSFEKVYI